jgi:hypothetical protein
MILLNIAARSSPCDSDWITARGFLEPVLRRLRLNLIIMGAISSDERNLSLFRTSRGSEEIPVRHGVPVTSNSWKRKGSEMARKRVDTVDRLEMASWGRSWNICTQISVGRSKDIVV